MDCSRHQPGRSDLIEDHAFTVIPSGQRLKVSRREVTRTGEARTGDGACGAEGME